MKAVEGRNPFPSATWQPGLVGFQRVFATELLFAREIARTPPLAPKPMVPAPKPLALETTPAAWPKADGPVPALALRPREAAKALGVSTRTLATWTKQGVIPYVRCGRTLLYPTAELAGWLSAESRKSKAERKS